MYRAGPSAGVDLEDFDFPAGNVTKIVLRLHPTKVETSIFKTVFSWMISNH